MIIEIKVPSPGESITEVEISSWLVTSGDYVKKNQTIAEIDSDKATLEIVAEEEGIIKLLIKKGEKIKIGDIIGLIDTSKSKKSKFNKKKDIYNKIASPSARKIIKEKNIKLQYIRGTGKNGRITKKDCNEKNLNISQNTYNVSSYSRKYTIIPLSTLRKKISERLVNVKNTTAMLTTFNEVDLSTVISIRNIYKDKFKEKHGVNLGFMSFFTIASIRGLKLYPDINSSIQDNNKIHFNYYDISIAISGPKGLVVPVIRNAEHLTMKEIEIKIKQLSEKVKNGTIAINEMTGGTFTITNGGIFGSMLSTPIINPPQSAILGMHKIVERSVVVNNFIQIRPIMYLALSYDHRIIDGKESVGFLMSIKESLENPIELLMGGKDNILNKLEIN